MPDEHVQLIEQFRWDGPLTVPQSLLIGGAVVGLLVWIWWRTPRRAPQRWLPVLWFLRLVALAVLLWMLLGPTQVSVRRHLTPKTVAVVTDISGSMQTVDAGNPAEDVRWGLAAETEIESVALQSCDKAIVSSRSAVRQIDLVLKLISQQADGKRIQTEVSALEVPLARVGEHLERLYQTSLSSSQGISSVILQVRAQFQGPILEAVSAWISRAKADDSNWTLADVAQLENLRDVLKTSAARLERWSYPLAEQVVEQRAPAIQKMLATTSSRTREERVADVLTKAENAWVRELSETVRVRWLDFGREATRRTGISAVDNPNQRSNAYSSGGSGEEVEDSFTNLSAALDEVQRLSDEETLVAAVVISDGRHNDPEAKFPIDAARNIDGLPVHVLPLGQNKMPRDVILHHVKSPAAVVEDDQLAIDALISTYDCADETCVIELKEAGEVVAREVVTVDNSRSDHRVRLVSKPTGIGTHEYELVVHSLADEVSEENNSSQLKVDVIDATLRVLLADGLPRWEFRYLVNLFERDERVEYDQLLFHPERKGTGFRAGQATFPESVDEWMRYRVVILGDVSPKEFSEQSQRSLREYVAERGGTLFLIAGPGGMPDAFTGMPLAELLPVESAGTSDRRTGYLLDLSAEGRMADALQLADEPQLNVSLWRTMTQKLPVYSLSEYSRPKPTSRTLIHAIASNVAREDSDARSFLCWQTVGRGRVVYLAAPVSYQLRLQHGDRYHHRFWGQMIRWAVARDLAQGSKTVRLSTDKQRIAQGEEVQVVVQLSFTDGEPMRDAKVRVAARREDEELALLNLNPDEKIPGRYLGRMQVTEPGNVAFEVGGDDVERLLSTEGFHDKVTTNISVDPALSTEMTDTRSDRALLSQVAELTGGQVLQPTALEEVFRAMDLSPIVREESLSQPLWNRWIYLFVILGCLSLEWSVRKLTGLP